MDKLNTQPSSNSYICICCGVASSVECTKPGDFVCTECLKVYEGGKFYPKH